MAFSNESIKAPKPGIPHIVYVDGYWRVSKCPKGGDPRWTKAHDHARALNTK